MPRLRKIRKLFLLVHRLNRFRLLVVAIALALLVIRVCFVESWAYKPRTRSEVDEALEGRLKGRRRDISMGVLFHGEYDSLERAMTSWKAGGLLRYVGEVIFFLNGVNSEGADEFKRRIERVDGGMSITGVDDEGLKVHVMLSEANLKLGVAITRMVEAAKHEHFLLMEKDWALVEDGKTMVGMLDGARELVDNGVHVVRLRSRERPGAPLHGRIMHEGREKSILRQQENLFCYAHHWLEDPLRSYPSFFEPCPLGRLSEQGMEETVCSRAKYCQWTNNPCMFKRQWFLTVLARPYMELYNRTAATEPNNPMLDFEFFTNWDNRVWNQRNFTVALPKGLFEHQEVNEQTSMNTIWYAWSRLRTDVQDLLDDYLDHEKTLRTSAAPNHDIGWTISDRFPTEFVRLYHYKDAMARTQYEAVRAVEASAHKARTKLEKGRGSWRHAVTTVTDELFKSMLFHPVVEPKDMRITFVTSLFDAKEDSQDFRASIEALVSVLEMLRAYPRVIYATESTVLKLEKMLSKEATSQTMAYFVPTSTQDLVKKFIKPEVFDRIEKIQARGALQAAIGLSRPYILHDAAINRNLFNRTHYVYIGATSNCLAQSFDVHSTLTPSNDHILRAHLMNNFFVLTNSTTLPFLADFPVKELSQELDLRALPAAVDLVSGEMMGGSPLAISGITSHYDAILRYTSMQNRLAGMKILLSIAYKNVAYHFNPFSIANICKHHPQGSYGCGQRVNQRQDHQGACSLFKWAASAGP